MGPLGRPGYGLGMSAMWAVRMGKHPEAAPGLLQSQDSLYQKDTCLFGGLSGKARPWAQSFSVWTGEGLGHGLTFSLMLLAVFWPAGLMHSTAADVWKPIALHP